MKQLFVNNAKTTLAAAITAASTSITATDASLFPSPGTNEYFLATLELSGTIEIVMITSRSANVLTIGGLIDTGNTIPGRGQELTTAAGFATGARLECRLTKGTLSRHSTSMAAITTVDSVVAPSSSYYDGFVAANFDPYGNPVFGMTKDANTWRFTNFTSQFSATVIAGSPTTATAASISAPLATSGKYIIQFLSGALVGQLRAVTATSATTVTWGTATSAAPANGSIFEVLKSNASIFADLLLIGDDAVIMPLLLGGD